MVVKAFPRQREVLYNGVLWWFKKPAHVRWEALYVKNMFKYKCMYVWSVSVKNCFLPWMRGIYIGSRPRISLENVCFFYLCFLYKHIFSLSIHFVNLYHNYVNTIMDSSTPFILGQRQPTVWMFSIFILNRYWE